jgi:alpha-N-arabinofuranosidase
VDGISLHRYFDNTSETGGDSAKFLALNLRMEQQINEAAAVCDYVRGRKRSPKKLWLSFDEWNVWYRARTGAAVNGNRQVAPHLLEEIYNLEDALLVGGLINSLIRSSNRVRIGCLAQLVNVIAPIMTNADGFYRQTIYHPYSWALQFAQGTALDVHVDPGPTYEVPKFGQVPYVDVAGTWYSADNSVSLFLLNRDLAKPHQVEVHWGDIAASKLLSASVITGTDLKAVNSFGSPNNVAPQNADKPVLGGNVMKIELPPRSYSLYRWGA